MTSVKVLTNQVKKSFYLKQKVINDMVNFYTYLPGQRFLSPDMIDNDLEEDYNRVNFL